MDDDPKSSNRTEVSAEVSTNVSADVSEVHRLVDELREQIGRVVFGQERVVEGLLVALLSEGHVLLEGPPGTAKTLLARTFAATLWLRFEGPLGLVHQTLRQPLHRTLPVVPDVPRVRSEALRFLDSRDARAGVKVVRYVGDGSEFESLREFQPGLDPRAIDWKASARHTQLLSRELRAERNHRIVLGLDTGRLMAEPVAGMPLLDHAIHAALLLSFISLRHGDRVSLFPFAARPGRLSPPRGGTAALRALVRLAGELRYSTDETNFTLGRLRRGGVFAIDAPPRRVAPQLINRYLEIKRREMI